jgi:hypothetical protein
VLRELIPAFYTKAAELPIQIGNGDMMDIFVLRDGAKSPSSP